MSITVPQTVHVDIIVATVSPIQHWWHDVLEAVRPYGMGGTRLDRIDWTNLLDRYDYKILAELLKGRTDLTPLEKAFMEGPPADQGPSEDSASEG